MDIQEIIQNMHPMSIHVSIPERVTTDKSLVFKYSYLTNLLIQTGKYESAWLTLKALLFNSLRVPVNKVTIIRDHSTPAYISDDQCIIIIGSEVSEEFFAYLINFGHLSVL